MSAIRPPDLDWGCRGLARYLFQKLNPVGKTLLLSPLLLLLCCQLITLGSLGRTLQWLGGHLAAVTLTLVLLFLLELALLLAVGRPFWAVLCAALPMTALAVASALKEKVNGTPLLISDLSMAGRAGTIAGFLRPGMGLGAGAILAGVLLLAMLVALAVFGRGKALSRNRGRLLGCGLVALLTATLLITPPVRAFTAGREGESQAGRNDRLGLLLGLYSAGVQNVMSQPGDYTEDNLNRLLLRLESRAEPTPKGEVTPNVVLLVSESFFDVTRLPGVDFDTDPIPNFRALAARWPAGTFLSNTYGGGTGNVEMELFTGIPSAFLGAGESLTTLTDPGVYSRLPSLVRTFSRQGYETAMVHTYDSSLYNRAANLPAMGFDCLLYQEDFPRDAPEAGGYLSDAALVDELIRQFESKGEDPIFLYGLSMENHPPYHKDKFGEPSGIGISSALLDQAGTETMDALLYGLRDADAALKRLTDYFSRCGEPVLLVFLGDHLPGLYVQGEDNLYTLLGYSSSNDTESWGPEELKRMHSTDFLVWNNYGAQLSVPESVSCTGLGAQLLAWAGVERPLYFQWVDSAMQEVLLYRPRLFVDGEGQPYSEPPEEATATVDAWRDLVYDILYGQQYVAEKIVS